ncbi:Exocyst complex component 5 [Thoreauomyces humboldtii]|nr:Exocyst complex component 5 [Thoreauomyces humboldtii]
MAGRRGTITSPKNPVIEPAREVVKLELFKGKFVASDFVETLSANLVVRAQSNTPRQFDPKPFIRNFEASIDELLRLKRKVHNKIEDLEDQAEASDKARRKKLMEINEAMQDAQTAFESLESRLGDVGKTAINIGEQLETIDKQRTRAAEAKDLIQYFIEFNAGNTRRLDQVKATGPEGEFKTAVIVRRLNAVAKEVDLAGTESARASIEEYSERLEKELLERFDDAYSDGDKEVMNECAKSLVEFNGGESCIRAYVNQHEFFMNQSKLGDPEGDGTEEEEHGDAQVATARLIRLCDEIRTTCKQEWNVIRAVFPNAPVVMQQFIQRIFAQSIQTQLESVLRCGDEVSVLEYLRALSMAHSTILSLANDLHKLDEDVVAGNSGKPALTAIINRSFDDLFVPYIEGGKYIETEKECLANVFTECLATFQEYAVERAKTPRGKAVSKPAPVSAPSSPTKLSPTSAEAMMSKLVSTMNNLGQEVAQQIGLQPAREAMSPEEMGLPSVSLMLKLLEAHVEAMRRCKELTSSSETAKHGALLFNQLIETVGVRYLEVALDMMIEDLQFADARTQPNFEQLPMVQVAQKILQLLQLHFQTSVVPLLSSSPTAHRDIVVYKNGFMATVEHRLNVLVQKQLDAIISWLAAVLATQKKTEFRPKDEEMHGNGLIATPPCVQCTEFLRSAHAQASRCLAGENLDNFMTEIGSAFHSMLLDHLKKFVVSQAGGLILLKDLATYQQSVAAFKIALLNERFDMLRELGNLFVVKPETLKTVINESHLSRIELPLLQPFLSQRADWSKLAKLERDLFQPGAQRQQASGVGRRPAEPSF